MIYEVWSRFGTSESECLGIHDGHNEAMMFAEQMKYNGYPRVDILVYDNEDESLLYSTSVDVAGREYA